MSLEATNGAVPGTVNVFVSSADGATLTLDRIDPDGVLRPVRNGQTQTMVGGEWIGEDNEAPLGVEVTYRANVTTDTGTQQQEQGEVYTSEGTWGAVLLDDTLDPSKRVEGRIDTWGDVARATNVTTYPVVGSSKPIAVSGTLGARTGSFTLAFRDLEDIAQVQRLMETATTLLLRTGPDFGVGSLYFAATSFSEARVSRLGFKPHRRVNVEYTEIAPVAGIALGSAVNSWFAVNDGFATWQAVLDQRTDWTDVLTRPPGVP